MAKGNKKSLFWTSYSDLMTSLFFTLLVLFVVAIIAMGRALKKANTLQTHHTLLLHALGIDL